MTNKMQPKYRSREEIEALRNECKSMVTKRAGLSAGAAVVPVPGVDVGADVALLMAMLPAINQKFGLGEADLSSDPKLKQYVLVAATSRGSDLIGRAITKQIVKQLLKRLGISVASKSVAKFVPIIGQAVSAGLSFGVMKYVGNKHVDDCYNVAMKIFEQQEADADLPDAAGG
ncbi:hypothetical protein [Caballeronia insecticola]|nr:hypothetical protein [Caballeronia insecticola]